MKILTIALFVLGSLIGCKKGNVTADSEVISDPKVFAQISINFKGLTYKFNQENDRVSFNIRPYNLNGSNYFYFIMDHRAINGDVDGITFQLSSYTQLSVATYNANYPLPNGLECTFRLNNQPYYRINKSGDYLSLDILKIEKGRASGSFRGRLSPDNNNGSSEQITGTFQQVLAQ